MAEAAATAAADVKIAGNTDSINEKDEANRFVLFLRAFFRRQFFFRDFRVFRAGRTKLSAEAGFADPRTTNSALFSVFPSIVISARYFPAAHIWLGLPVKKTLSSPAFSATLAVTTALPAFIPATSAATNCIFTDAGPAAVNMTTQYIGLSVGLKVDAASPGCPLPLSFAR
jgi:hypothetical protein